jgi:hypothetical protein
LQECVRKGDKALLQAKTPSALLSVGSGYASPDSSYTKINKKAGGIVKILLALLHTWMHGTVNMDKRYIFVRTTWPREMVLGRWFAQTSLGIYVFSRSSPRLHLKLTITLTSG